MFSHVCLSRFSLLLTRFFPFRPWEPIQGRSRSRLRACCCSFRFQCDLVLVWCSLSRNHSLKIFLHPVFAWVSTSQIFAAAHFHSLSSPSPNPAGPQFPVDFGSLIFLVSLSPEAHTFCQFCSPLLVRSA
jgi:hypothetical protein